MASTSTAMNRVHKIFRIVALVILAIAIGLPALLYVALSLPVVQRGICTQAEHRLSDLLGVNVDIDYISVTPFNRLTLHSVSVADGDGKPAVTIDRLGSGISISSLVFHGDIVVTYAEIIGLHADIHRDSMSAPLNIQPIIDALSPKDKNNKPKHYDLSVNTVVLRKSSVRYRVLDHPADSLRFSPADVYVSDIKADLSLPRISNDDYQVEIRRLSAREQSGLYLSGFSGSFSVSDTAATISGLEIRMPSTQLAFAPVAVSYPSLKQLPKVWQTLPVELRLLDGSHVTPSSFAALVPQLRALDRRADLKLDISGTPRHLRLNQLSVEVPSMLKLSADGAVDNPFAADSLKYTLDNLTLDVNLNDAMAMMPKEVTLSKNLAGILAAASTVNVELQAEGTLSDGRAELDLASPLASLTAMANYASARSSAPRLTGNVQIASFEGLRLADVMPSNFMAQISDLEAEITADVSFPQGRRPAGSADVSVGRVEYRGETYTDIEAQLTSSADTYLASIHSQDSKLDVTADVQLVNPKSGMMELDAHAVVNDLNLAGLGVKGARQGYALSGAVFAQLHGTGADDIQGVATVDNLRYIDRQGKGLRIESVKAEATDSLGKRFMTLRSDIADADISGTFKLTHVPRLARGMVSRVLPDLVSMPEEKPKKVSGGRRNTPAPEVHHHTDSLTYSITIKDSAPIASMVKLPVSVIYPIDINGELNADKGRMWMSLSAPYLQQGNKLIEETTLDVAVLDVTPDNPLATAKVTLTSVMPTKKGPLSLTASANALGGNIDTRLRWSVQRERRFSGDVSLSTRFTRQPTNELGADIHINPGEMVFNDTVWSVAPALITYDGHKHMEVRDFRVGRPGQFVTLSGTASDSDADTLTLDLRDVSLDYIFETLNIANVTFGGNATGQFYVTSLFTGKPQAYTPRLLVNSLSYNGCVLGDAVIGAQWNPDTKAIGLDADITGFAPGRPHSYIDGDIKPMADSLDLRFRADNLPVGFLKPVMSAFATDVSGHAFGSARLFGSFKNVDLTGDLYADSVRITIGYTNVTYMTSDSIHLRPGRIDVRDITLFDPKGNKARFSGSLRHRYFKDAQFDFRVSDARNFLVYDVKDSGSDTWYGRIFGNGLATISGRPGSVDIGVEMSTAPNSTFTFVLSNELSAGEYNFITFRDRDRAAKDSIAALTAPPDAVRTLKERMNAGQTGNSKTNIKINLGIDVTPQAQMVLLMDPAGGDRIRAYGSGNMRLIYDTSNDDMRINGKYTVERGNYNFTLQDIIIKDFNIKEGSSITFHGDPMAAELDIEATYAVNANLSDLDESFLADKELNRTNVPVHALLRVDGDLRQPDISFDLEFPTLTQETYRKVRSIVNTDDMMNRQIIYLLALNRFYTPEYMTGTHGNELVSVASSTISSQLSNMLGQLSDNWNIAPNFRSDKGDFSDVEVDVALSSHLLNNRLILNGNLGYRDKTLNNNSFVGDFDIEYLLNRSGSIRLKAYNRYNDRNYYVKSALTTQGVGIMFKRDFDDALSFIKRWLRKRKQSQQVDSTAVTPAAADTVQSQHTDSIGQ